MGSDQAIHGIRGIKRGCRPSGGPWRVDGQAESLLSYGTETPSQTIQPLITTLGRKLKLLQAHDPLKQWWSLDEMRFCAKCNHLFLGRDIRFFEDDRQVVHFRCPSFQCDGGFHDWEYPELHL